MIRYEKEPEHSEIGFGLVLWVVIGLALWGGLIGWGVLLWWLVT